MSEKTKLERFGRIDCHHHVFPSDLKGIVADPKMDWKTPQENFPWSPELSLKTMDSMNIEMAILSYPPGVPAGGDSSVVRDANIALKALSDRFPDRFGFFACLGDLRNVQDVLKEIKYSLDVLKAQGVSIVSSYGEAESTVYIADDTFDPIWAELDNRRATVFLHGMKITSARPNPHPFLGVPIVEVPNETFKAASHLVVTGKKRKFPQINFILSHFGGSAPFLAPRVAILSRHMGSCLTPEEIIADFKTFYYDTALSAHDHTLLAMKAFVGSDRILFGTDFPAVSKDMVEWFTKNVDEFYDAEEKGKVMRSNILRLLSNVA